LRAIVFFGESQGICKKSDCISCRLYRSVEDVRAILLDELWLSEAELQHHLRSERYRKILLVVEMAQEPPEIRFDIIARSSGVDTIEKARNQTGHVSST